MRRKNPPREDLPQPTPSRGYVRPLTLGDIDLGEDIQIEAECTWCRRNARIEIAPLVEKWGPDTPFRYVVQRLVCSECGWRIVEAWPIGRHKKRISPNDDLGHGFGERLPPTPFPPLAECRAILAAVPRVPGISNEQHSAYMQALMDRWPEIGASRALFIVRYLAPSE